MAHSDTDMHIKCTIKKAISLRVGNPSVEFKSGCSVVDVIFPGELPIEVWWYRKVVMTDKSIIRNFNYPSFHTH